MSKEKDFLVRAKVLLECLDTEPLQDQADLIAKEIQELLAQPEQEPVGYLYKQMDCCGEWATIFKVDKPYITWHDIKDIVPLYLTPPKREPIEDGELEVWYSQHAWSMDKQEYIWGFRDAEKAHGIGVDDE